MPNTINLHVASMVAQARSEIEEIEAKDATSLSDDPKVVFVDLRDIRERQRSGYIPNSFHCPRGMAEFWVDPKSPYFKDIFDRDVRFIFYCASGWRSALTLQTLQKMGFQNAAHLAHGFTSWTEAGGPVERQEGAK